MEFLVVGEGDVGRTGDMGCAAGAAKGESSTLALLVDGDGEAGSTGAMGT